jgi:alanyl-tRNA synthetase
MNAASGDAMKDVADRVRAKLPSSVVVLGAAIDGAASFVAAVTPDLVSRGVNAGAIVRDVARIAGGGGGGSAGLAQAGAKDASRLGAALEQAASLGAAAIEAASRQ